MIDPVASLERALTSATWTAGPKDLSARALLGHLYEVHRELWALEDRARSARATPDVIASIKREIDRWNGKRHELIGALDRPFLGHASEEATRRYSESPGELCDRMLILALKINAARALAEDNAAPADHRAECAVRAERLGRWRSHLAVSLSEELADFAAGRALLPPRAEFKMYNDPRFNPVMRDEASLEELRRPR